jgi:hypothetical protein
MRRLVVAPLVLAVAAAGAAGCAGSEGAEAQDLLARSQQAVARVDSYHFAARIWTSGASQGFTMVMKGGGYGRGKRAGDFYLEARVEGVPGFERVTMVSRKGVLYMNAGTGWTPLPGESSPAQPALAGFDWTQYVEKVDVQEGILVGGEPMTKITGTFDTKALAGSPLGQLGGGSGISTWEGLGAEFGDTRAVIYVSEVTNLPMRGLVDLPMKILDQTVTTHVDYALSRINEPVKIPNPA